MRFPHSYDLERRRATARILGRQAQTRLLEAGVILAFVSLAIVLFVFVPRSLVTKNDVRNPTQRLKLENDVRATGIQLLGGAVLALGAVFTAATLRLNRSGQVTERYSRAVDQLASEDVSVRMGGIFALERIARESRRDHGSVFEVLCAFARHRKRPEVTRRKKDEESEALADVQAVLNVIVRRNSRNDPIPDLIDLDGADMRACALDHANLRRSSMQSVDLRDSVVTDCDVRYALLIEADLRNAFLDSDFRHAVFTEADLTGATIFSSARFDEALYSKETRWPEGFDPAAAGAVLFDVEKFNADITEI